MRKRGFSSSFLLLKILVTAVIILGFGVMIMPARASAPAIPNTGSSAFCNGCGAAAQTIALTVANVGDVIVVGAAYAQVTTTAAHSVSTVTDGGDTFAQIATITGYCNTNRCGSKQPFGAEMWFGIAVVAGAITITVTWDSGTNLVAASYAFDVINTQSGGTIQTTPYQNTAGSCNDDAVTTCANPTATASATYFTPGQAVQMGIVGFRDGLDTPGSGYTLLQAGGGAPAAEFSTTASSVTTPTSYPFCHGGSCSSGSATFGWAEIGVTLSTSGVATTTTTANAVIVGCNTNTGADHALTASNTYFYASQLNQINQLISNLTTIITNGNAAAQTINLAVYTTAGSNTPSAINPLVQRFHFNYSVPGLTTDKQIYVIPNVGVGQNNWVAIAIGLPSGSTSISIRNPTTCGNLRSVAGDAPQNINSLGADSTFAGYLWASISYTIVTTSTFTSVSLSTVTATVTSTVTGVITSTFSVTTVVTSIDAAAAISGLPALTLLIILVVGPALLLGVATKSPIGAIFGALLGAGIGAIPAPQGPGIIPFWFIGVVVLGCLVMLFFMKPSGGGGQM